MFGLFKKNKKKQLFNEISKSNKLSVKLISLLGQAMMYADGTADEEEAKPLITLSAEHGVSPTELKEFHDKVGKNPEFIPELIKLLTYTERKLVIQTLGMIMIMDGEVHDNELDFLVKVGSMMNMDEDKVVKIYQAKIRELAEMQESDDEVEELLSNLNLNQRFAIFFILIKIAESDGYTDDEQKALEEIASELNISIDDFNKSKIDGSIAVELLKDISENYKSSLSKLIAIVVGADGEFSSEESSWVLDIISQLGLDVSLMSDLVEKFSKKEDSIENDNFLTNDEKKFFENKEEVEMWINNDSKNSFLNDDEKVLLNDIYKYYIKNRTLTKNQISSFRIIREKVKQSLMSKLQEDFGKKNISIKPKNEFKNTHNRQSNFSTKDENLKNNKENYNIVENSEVEENARKLLSIYPNLMGIDFSDVNFSFDKSSHQEFFLSDIDGKWRFAISQMSMLFKAFSKNNFDKALITILKSNSIELDSFVQKSNFKQWNGNGFQIEHTIIDNVDIIVITNENVVQENSFKLRTTNLAAKVAIPVGYQSLNFDNLYDGNECLKNNNGKIPLNVPFIFSDEQNDLKYILIRVTTLTLAKYFIDEINKNHFGSLKRGEDKSGWNYFHYNKFFTIGYLEEHMCVRINLLHNFVGVEEIDIHKSKDNKVDIIDELKISIYEKGGTVRDPETGNEFMLSNIEMSVYDFLLGSKMISEMEGKNLASDDFFQKGMKWFEEENPEVYNTLLK